MKQINPEILVLDKQKSVKNIIFASNLNLKEDEMGINENIASLLKKKENDELVIKLKIPLHKTRQVNYKIKIHKQEENILELNPKYFSCFISDFIDLENTTLKIKKDKIILYFHS